MSVVTCSLFPMTSRSCLYWCIVINTSVIRPQSCTVSKNCHLSWCTIQRMHYLYSLLSFYWFWETVLSKNIRAMNVINVLMNVIYCMHVNLHKKLILIISWTSGCCISISIETIVKWGEVKAKSYFTIPVLDLIFLLLL